MAERRQAHRREHIVVEVRGEEFEAHPLSWLRRNDLGNAVIAQYNEMFNSALQAYVNPDTQAPELDMKLNDKLVNPVALVKLAYQDSEVAEEVPGYSPPTDEFLGKLSWPELRELLYASLDVNELDTVRRLIDPNWNTPTDNGGKPTLEAGEILERAIAIPSPQSSEDSSPSESIEEPPQDLPSENSEQSSENTSEGEVKPELGT